MTNINPIIVIDGADGVGKTTQIELLKKEYNNKYNFVKFPVYDSNTGYFITQYLKGNFNNFLNELEYKDRIDKISTLYTLDRVCWFNENYSQYKPLICDRYTTSNIIHMSALIIKNGGNINDVYEYITNLNYTEYIKYKIPRPDIVIYLDASTEQLSKNLKGTHQVLDIHEDKSVYENIDLVKKQIIDYCGWEVIKCDDELGMRSIKNIHNDIINIINKI